VITPEDEDGREEDVMAELRVVEVAPPLKVLDSVVGIDNGTELTWVDDWCTEGEEGGGDGAREEDEENGSVVLPEAAWMSSVELAA